MEKWEWTISALGVLIGLAGLLYAIYERKQRTTVEAVIRESLRGLAGTINVLFSNANWADTHFRAIGYLFTEANPDLTGIRKRVLDGARDSAACARQLGLAHLQIRGIQKALFKDSEDTLPELRTDDVKAAVARLQGDNGLVKQVEKKSAI
jgi:hypothetical protein